MDDIRLMVVEDEAIIAHDIAGQVTTMGYEVVAIVDSGEEAVKKAEELQPDLVLMDIMLSGKLDGIEAAEVMRARWGTPVVFLTAYADTDKLKRAKLIYPTGYVIKPFQVNDLKISIEISLHISAAEKARQAAEKAMRESEERLRMIVEAALDAVIAVNTEGEIVLFNGAAEELFQYAEKEVFNQSVAILLREEMSQKHQQRLERFLKNGIGQCGHIGRRQEKVFRRKDGSLFDAEVSMSGGRSNGTRLVVLAIRDITERRRTENEIAILSEIRRVISSTLNIDEVYAQFAAEVSKLIPYDRIHVNLNSPGEEFSTTTYVYGIDVAGRRVGDKIELAGSITEAVLRTRKSFLIHPESAEDITARFPNVSAAIKFRAGMKSIMAVPLISGNDAIGVLHLRTNKPNAYTERDLRLAERVGLEISGAIANSQMFNNLRSREEELRKSEENYRTLVEQTECLINHVDENGCVTFVNDIGERIWGKRREELVGMLAFQLIHPDDMARTEAWFNQCVKAKLRQSSIENRQINALTGRVSHILWSSNFLYDEKGQFQGVNSIASDITERKLAEEELSSISRIGQIITSSPDIGEVYEQFCIEAGRLIHFDRLILNLLTQSQPENTRISYAFGLEVPGRMAGDSFPLNGSMAGEVLKKRSSLLCQPEDERELSARFPVLGPVVDAGIRSIISVPLIFRSEIIGVLHFQSKSRTAYTAKYLGLAEKMASHISGAIANARALGDLRKAIEEIQALRGIVPICSYCKKIRDDDGYWNQVEQYIRLHTDAKLSHGICPDCFKREMKEIIS